MARRVTVAAIRAFTYEGRPVAIGDRVAMWPLDAAAAGQRGQVSLTRPARGAQVAAPPPEAPEKRRRTYRRRDLQPEP